MIEIGGIMKYSVLIVAAGKGKRMNLGYNKVFHVLETGNTILDTTVDIFLKDSNCLQIIIAISASGMAQSVRSKESGKIVHVIGGSTRSESVFNGLMAVSQDYVLIHDAARPFVSQAIIDRVLKGLKDYNACIPVVKVKDTIKVIVEGVVSETPVRDNLVQAQTPQGFLTDLIISCYKQAKKGNLNFTDDSQVVELTSKEIIGTVQGSYNNYKITTMEDLPRR